MGEKAGNQDQISKGFWIQSRRLEELFFRRPEVDGYPRLFDGRPDAVDVVVVVEGLKKLADLGLVLRD